MARTKSDFYRPMRAYEFDVEKRVFLGRHKFIIGGQMSDGMKCWYKCDDNGRILDESRWYSMTRARGAMIAILEAVN